MIKIRNKNILSARKWWNTFGCKSIWVNKL